MKYLLLGLVCVALAGCGSKAPRQQAASRVATKVNVDMQRGTCSELQAHTQRHGVLDCFGKRWPGSVGRTHCEIWATPPQFSVRFESRLGRTCAVTELARNPNFFRLTSACVGIMDWQPNGAVNAACRREKDDWRARVMAHENYHVYQCELEVWKANKRWSQSRHKFSACAWTERGAMAELKKEIELSIQAEQQRVLQTIEREFDAYHRTPAGRPLVTDCNRCDR